MNTLHRLVLFASALAIVPFQTAIAHPLHMSFTEIRRVDRSGTIELSVRVFADDFSTAAARFTRARIDSSQIIDSQRAFAYLLANISVSDGTRAPVKLVPCGMSRVTEMLRLCVRGRLTNAGVLQVANRLMADLFADQVNVVQLVGPRSRSSRMFVKGDGWKPLS